VSSQFGTFVLLSRTTGVLLVMKTLEDEWYVDIKAYKITVFEILRDIYQPAARKARGRLVLRLLCRFCICISVYLCICASALITCAIITSHTLLPCDLTLVDFGN